MAIPKNVQEQADYNKNRSPQQIEDDKKKKGKVATYPDGPNGKAVYVPIGEETAKQGKPINDAIDRQIASRKETDAWLQNQYDKSPLGQSELNSANIANEKAQRIADLAKQKAFDAETIRRQEISGYTESRADIIKGQNQEAVNQKSQDSVDDNSERGKRIKKFLGKSLSQVRDENPVLDAPSVATSGKQYTPEEIRANQQALNILGQENKEKAAIREQAQRNQYRSFLADRGEDPDTIGDAMLQKPEMRQGETRADKLASVLQNEGKDDYMNRAYALSQLRKEQSTPRRMRPPTFNEEQKANDAIAQFHKERSMYTNAANRVRNPEVAKNLIVERDTMYPLQRSSEVNRKARLARYRKPSPFEQNLENSNGYGP